MKKWLLLIVIALLIGYEWMSRDKEDAKADLNIKTVRVSADNGSKTLTVIPKGQIYQGNLLLVNKDYPVHDTGVSQDIVRLLDHEEPDFRLPAAGSQNAALQASRGEIHRDGTCCSRG